MQQISMQMKWRSTPRQKRALSRWWIPSTYGGRKKTHDGMERERAFVYDYYSQRLTRTCPRVFSQIVHVLNHQPGFFLLHLLTVWFFPWRDSKSWDVLKNTYSQSTVSICLPLPTDSIKFDQCSHQNQRVYIKLTLRGFSTDAITWDPVHQPETRRRCHGHTLVTLIYFNWYH